MSFFFFLSIALLRFSKITVLLKAMSVESNSLEKYSQSQESQEKEPIIFHSTFSDRSGHNNLKRLLTFHDFLTGMFDRRTVMANYVCICILQRLTSCSSGTRPITENQPPPNLNSLNDSYKTERLTNYGVIDPADLGQIFSTHVEANGESY